MTTKQQILAMLLDSPGRDISGEALAAGTGVSRAAVWKAISALRQEGYSISAVTNRGYRLTGSREIISEAAIQGLLKTRRFGRNIETYPVIDSTNRRAKELAEAGAPEGTLVCARGQTGGRGRMGRRFSSPADAGIYMSCVLRPQIPSESAVLLTCRCAVAVSRAIEKLAEVECRIKWVNDIFIGGKKVCGILCEGQSEIETGLMTYAVAGIGINVSPMEFEAELRGKATSIGNETGKELSKNALIAEICLQLENCGDDFIDEYISRSMITGKRVAVTDGVSGYEATVTGIDRSCALMLDTGYGKRLLRTGEIKILEDN